MRTHFIPEESHVLIFRMRLPRNLPRYLDSLVLPRCERLPIRLFGGNLVFEDRAVLVTDTCDRCIEVDNVDGIDQ
jgi:hypothetical protein